MKASHQFLFTTFGITAAVFLVFGLWLVRHAADEEWGRFQWKMDALNRLVAAENRDPLWNADQAAAMENSRRVFEDPEVVMVSLLDPAGAVTVNLVEPDVPPETIRTHRFEIRQGVRMLARAEVSYTTRWVQARLRRWWGGLIGLAVVTGGMLWLAHMQLTFKVWRPLRRLAVELEGTGSTGLREDRAAPEVRQCMEAYASLVEGVVSRREVDGKRITALEKRNAELEKRIREKEEVEGTLRQAQKMEAVARVSGGVGAEFNNLLTSILGFSAMARDQLQPNQQAYADIEEVLHAGERARGLTQQLLSLGRRRQLEMKMVNAKALLDSAVTAIRETVGTAVDVDVDAEGPFGNLLVDEGALRQVFTALAENAKEAMPQGGRLRLEAKEVFLEQQEVRHLPDLDPGSYVHISISDTGVGMRDAVKERAFEPFFTTRGPDRAGLGLATAHGIVRQFKGDVELHSERGRGTEVVLYLPLHAVEAPLQAPPPAEQPVAAESKVGQETVLVVEDEETVRRMTRRLLEDKGYNVLEAPDGAVALQMVAEQTGRIDLILSDVVMPNLSGPDMVREIRAIRDDFKVLYMSGFAETKLPDADESGRRVHLMLKPFTREILYRRVREVIDETPEVPA